MAAPTFLSASAIADNNANTIVWDAGHSAGTMGIAWIVVAGSQTASMSTSGLTAFTGSPWVATTNGARVTIYAWYREATSGAESDIAMVNDAEGNNAVGAAFYDGADTPSILGDTGGVDNNGTAISIPGGSVAAESVVVSIVASGADTTSDIISAFTNADLATVTYRAGNHSNAGNGVGTYIGDGISNTAQTIGATTATATISDRWTAINIEIPAAAGGGTTLTRTATVAATSTLTAAAAVTSVTTRTATVAATSTLTAAASVTRSGVASIAATSTLTATAAVTSSTTRTATIAATSTIGAVGAVTLPRAVTIAGTSTLGAVAAVTTVTNRTAAMAHYTELDATYSLTSGLVRSAVIAGASTLSAVASVLNLRAATVAAASAFTAVASVSSGLGRAASIAATSTLSATASVTIASAAAIAATSTLTASASVTSGVNRQASIAATSTISAVQSTTRARAASVDAVSTLAAVYSVSLARQVSIAATSTLTATALGLDFEYPIFAVTGSPQNIALTGCPEAFSLTGSPISITLTGGPPMATTSAITGTHKDETFVCNLYARAPGGTDVIETPASQTITMTIAETAGGSPLLEVTSWTLADAGTGLFTKTISEADLSTMTEGRLYHYNIWSENGGTAFLQAKGTLVRMQSIGPT